MKKQFIIMIMLISLMIIPLVSAESDASYTFKQNELTDLKIPVFDENNNPVNESTTCYLTITNKNGYVINNQQMTNQTGGIYNYSFSISNIGETQGSISCSDGTTSGFSTFTIDVTPSGFQGTLGFYFIIITILGGLLILGFTIKDGWFVVFGGMGLIGLGIFSFINGIAGFKDTLVTQGTSLFFIGVGAYLAINAALEMINESE